MWHHLLIFDACDAVKNDLTQKPYRSAPLTSDMNFACKTRNTLHRVKIKSNGSEPVLHCHSRSSSLH
ncbi:hypothetical protein V9T40_014004 [Parthenolecanium corni]|uniref:Uncharacterized protein n=1 Tax=Parthenolecanium corni TaxID=536013 RepID=A0AAN9TDP8_9HEMI